MRWWEGQKVTGLVSLSFHAQGLTGPRIFHIQPFVYFLKKIFIHKLGTWNSAEINNPLWLQLLSQISKTGKFHMSLSSSTEP